MSKSKPSRARTYEGAPSVNQGGKSFLTKMWLFSLILTQFQMTSSEEHEANEEYVELSAKNGLFHLSGPASPFLVTLVNNLREWFAQQIRNSITSAPKNQDFPGDVLGIQEQMETVNNEAIRNLTETMEEPDVSKITRVPQEVWEDEQGFANENVVLPASEVGVTDQDVYTLAGLVLAKEDPSEIQQFVKNIDPILANALEQRTLSSLVCLGLRMVNA